MAGDGPDRLLMALALGDGLVEASDVAARCDTVMKSLKLVIAPAARFNGSIARRGSWCSTRVNPQRPT
jgi:hypothetical protein